MSSNYKIDRINLISYKTQKRKELFDLRCRYLAKSRIVNCNAKNKNFYYVNWRGSQFTKVKFCKTKFFGCDFIGTRFNSCCFEDVLFEECTFVACTFRNCTVKGTVFRGTAIVNTTIPLDMEMDKCEMFSTYPQETIDYDLYIALESLRDNYSLRKNKILFLGDNKYNGLNIYLLQRRFGNKRLAPLLLALGNISTKSITTYKKLERTLKGL